MNNDLLEGLATLQQTRVAFARIEKGSVAALPHRLARLDALVATIGSDRPARPRYIPEEYLLDWRNFVSGKKSSLEPRAIKFLCWVPDIAIDIRLHRYLDSSEVRLGSRSLQGLLSSCHSRWTSDMGSSDVCVSLRRKLRAFEGSNRAVNNWKDNPRIVAGADAPSQFAGKMLENLEVPVAEHAKRWAIPDHSAFMRAAVIEAVEKCQHRISTKSNLVSFLIKQLLQWDGWELRDFKNHLSRWILSPHPQQIEELHESLKQLALTKLGDLRNPSNAARWLGIKDAAKDEFIKWLSRGEIEFFFDHVLPEGADPHGRKDFWLRYVGQVRQSRALLNKEDRDRFRLLPVKVKEKIGSFGFIEGTSSAFLLDFGAVLAIEFSVAGNACFIYERAMTSRIVPDFWTAGAFSNFQLKKNKYSVERIIHRRGIWTQHLSQTLAGFGIRPGTQ
jgi:hypothetical protein